MLDMYKGLVNSPETTITNNIGTTDTIIYVLDRARVPAVLPNLMVLGTGTNAETVKVTAINDNALTVERGFQGIAKDWLAGTIIARNFTEYDYAALVDNVNELELTKETPAGAQAKANAAESAANNFTSGLIGLLSSLKTAAKDKIVNAINEMFDAHAAHLAENVSEVINITRDLSLTGTQKVNQTINKKAKAMVIFAGVGGANSAECNGMWGYNGQGCLYKRKDNGAIISNANAIGFSDSSVSTTSSYGNIGNIQSGSFDIEWSHLGTGATGTATIKVLVSYHGE